MPGGVRPRHHATAATSRTVNKGVEGGHLPSPTDQARVGAPNRPLT